MSFLEAILLGIIQGLTEFLPISSSAHLVIVPHFFGWDIPEQQAFIFNVLVQLGTLLAVIVYFWKDLVMVVSAALRGLVERRPFATPEARLGWYIVLATIPAGLLGLLVKDQVEAAFSSLRATGAALYLTALMLFVVERVGKRNRPLEQMDWKDSLLMGAFQALAIFPGVSRSGSTMAGGMARNLERPAAARFSFLMSIPIMLAAGLVAGLDLVSEPGLVDFLPVVAVGFLFAAVVGYLSIRWLLRYLMRHSLDGFAVYCTIVGTITVVYAVVANI